MNAHQRRVTGRKLEREGQKQMYQMAIELDLQIGFFKRIWIFLGAKLNQWIRKTNMVAGHGMKASIESILHETSVNVFFCHWTRLHSFHAHSKWVIPQIYLPKASK